MKKYILLILVVSSLLSCEKTLKFDDEGLANQLVLNSIISTNKDFTASLTKSRSILGNTNNSGGLMAEGSLDIYLNDELIRNLNSPTGYFTTSGINPKAGDSYRIVINSNGKQLEAITKIPNQSEVSSIDTSTVSNEFGQWTNYKVNIKDPSGEDYYRLVLMTERMSFYTAKDSLGNDKRHYLVNTSQWLFGSDDPVFKSLYNNFGQDVIDAGPKNNYSIFTDDYFQGKEYSLKFWVFDGYNGGGYGNSEPGNPNLTSGIIYKRDIIHVQKLSKELFNYLKYLNLYDFYHGNPFSEPVQVYSNVKNGIGIFAGLNDDARFTFEKVYRPFSMDTITVEEGYSGGGYTYGSTGEK